MEHAGLRVRVRDAHLALESVRIPEEQAEDGSEVGDEPVGRAALDEPAPNASSDAACSPRWSMRPRPNIGVCRCASVFPVISNTFSSVNGPMSTNDRRTPSSSPSEPSFDTFASNTSR
jgi:hypothetical protein